jgi:hypothetical protein
MDNQTKKEGQEYSNLVIGQMKDILKIKDYYERQELIYNYGLDLEDDNNRIINYLITTGGPAYRLQITFNEDKELVSIKPQYQDWFTDWVTMETTSEQDETLAEFIDYYCLEETLYNE